MEDPQLIVDTRLDLHVAVASERVLTAWSILLQSIAPSGRTPLSTENYPYANAHVLTEIKRVARITWIHSYRTKREGTGNGILGQRALLRHRRDEQ